MNSIVTKPDFAEPTGLSFATLMRRVLGRSLKPARPGPHLVIQGHVNGSYSLAAVNRCLARTLERRRPGTVRVVPVEGNITADLSQVPAHEPIDDLVHRKPVPGAPYVVISQHFPVYVPDDPTAPALALFYWEETLVPIETVRCLNRHFRGVLAPSAFVAKVLVDSGVSIPVYLVGQAPPLDDFRRLAARQERHSETVSFLHVSSCMARKGVDVLLAAYLRAFRRGDKVRLVIKGFPNPHNEIGARVARIRASDPEAPEIVVINQDLNRRDLLALYADSDVMVLPTRGEGFNLPAAEAMAAGLSVIVTGFGGQMDFCNAETARLLDFHLAPSQSHVAGSHGLWAEPSIEDLVAALREATGNSPSAHARRSNAGRVISQKTSEAALVDRIISAATDCLMPRNAPASAILIDHDTSRRPWSILEGLVALHAEHGHPVAIRLAGTYDLELLPSGEKVLALATLSRVARVIVPSVGDAERLRRLGLGAKLVLIPPGANDALGEQLSGLLRGLTHEQRLVSWRNQEPDRRGESASG